MVVTLGEISAKNVFFLPSKKSTSRDLMKLIAYCFWIILGFL